MRQFCFTLLLLLCSSFLFSQSKVSDDYIEWSPTRKLTANDFIIGGASFIKELYAKIVSNMTKRRIEYDTDTKFAT